MSRPDPRYQLEDLGVTHFDANVVTLIESALTNHSALIKDIWLLSHIKALVEEHDYISVLAHCWAPTICAIIRDNAYPFIARQSAINRLLNIKSIDTCDPCVLDYLISDEARASIVAAAYSDATHDYSWLIGRICAHMRDSSYYYSPSTTH